MPPLKTYIYRHVTKDWVTIEIKSYEAISAKWILEGMVKEPKDFKLI